MLRILSRRVFVVRSQCESYRRPCFRYLSSGEKPTVKKPAEEKLTREEVEAIAERARNDQRIWDTERKLFGGGIHWGHPLFFLLVGGVTLLHFANGYRDEKLEQSEKHLERLKQRKLTKPLTRMEVDSLISHKKRQLQLWRSKVANTNDLTESEEARARVVKLQAEITELEFPPAPPT
mmetsp:Transcript_11468/g.15668  ORF Transcript_11468/g.15668 Transcript_11468/m.15668 type:complete len:178 (+) Transcript_11468:83-616(+)